MMYHSNSPIQNGIAYFYINIKIIQYDAVSSEIL
jgi:hypothetical protein